MKAWIFSILGKVWVFAKRVLTWYVCKNKNKSKGSYPSTTRNNRRRKQIMEDDHVKDE